MVRTEFLNFVFTPAVLADFSSPNRESRKWINLLREKMEFTHYAANQVLLSKSQIPNEIIFLYKGSVRARLNNEQGRACSFYLWSEPAIITDIIHYEERVPTDLDIEVSESSECLLISRSSIEKIIEEFPEASAFTHQLLVNFAKYHRTRDKDYTTTNAITMLRNVEHSFKKVYHRFSREEISSYLGKSRSWLHALKAKRK